MNTGFCAQIQPLGDDGRPNGPVLFEVDVELTVSITSASSHKVDYTVDQVFCVRGDGDDFDMLAATDPAIVGLGRRIKAQAECCPDLADSIAEEYFADYPSDRWAA